MSAGCWCCTTDYSTKLKIMHHGHSIKVVITIITLTLSFCLSKRLRKQKCCAFGLLYDGYDITSRKAFQCHYLSLVLLLPTQDGWLSLTVWLEKHNEVALSRDAKRDISTISFPSKLTLADVIECSHLASCSFRMV